jgi:hypothetical protein
MRGKLATPPAAPGPPATTSPGHGYRPAAAGVRRQGSAECAGCPMHLGGIPRIWWDSTKTGVRGGTRNIRVYMRTKLPRTQGAVHIGCQGMARCLRPQRVRVGVASMVG